MQKPPPPGGTLRRYRPELAGHRWDKLGHQGVGSRPFARQGAANGPCQLGICPRTGEARKSAEDHVKLVVTSALQRVGKGRQDRGIS